MEGLWNWVSEAAVSAVGVVWEWVNTAVSGLWSLINEGLSWLWNSVSGILGFFGYWMARAIGKTDAEAQHYRLHWDQAVWLPFNWLWDTINAGLSSVWGFVSAGLGSLWTSITGAFSGALGTLSGWFVDTWTFLSGVVGEVGDTLARGITGLAAFVSQGLGDLWTGFMDWGSNTLGAITTMFDGAVASIGGWVSDALAGVAKALGEGLSGFATWMIEGLQGLAVTFMGGLKALMTAVNAALRPIVVGFMDALTAAFTPGSPDKELEKAVNKMINATQGRMLSELKKAYKSPFDPTTIIAASLGVSGLALVAQLGVHSLASAAGISVLGTRLDVTDVVEGAVTSMGFPGIVGTSFLMPLQVGLFTPLRYAYNQMFTPFIPGFGDLIRFVVREVIKPADFTTNMGFHGYNKFWAAAYWEAHWVLPSYGNIIDAFHRGIITKDERDKYIVFHDYKPETRPGITVSDQKIMTGLMRTLIPRVDLRYAWEMGRINDEELQARYVGLGYEEDSGLMAEIQKGRAMTEEIHKVRDEWIRDFLEGYILEGTLRANLAAIGIGPLRVDYYVEYAKMRRAREHKADLLDAYWDGYLKDLVSDEELATRAGEIIVDKPARDLWLERAYIRKYKKPKVD